MNPFEPLYGREEDLEWVRSHLFVSTSERLFIPLLLLHGPEGIGKSSVLGAAKQLLTNHVKARKGRLVIFHATQQMAAVPVSEFPLALMQQGFCQPSITKPSIQSPASILAALLAESARLNGAIPDTYDAQGSPIVLTTDPQKVNRISQSVLAELFCRSLEEWIAKECGPTSDGPCIYLLFLMDDFPMYSPDIKTWLGMHLAEKLLSHGLLPNCGFLLTGYEPWEIGGQSDYWRMHPRAFFQRRLNSISRKACSEWLKAADCPLEWIDLLIEKTEGMPGKISALLQDSKVLNEWMMEDPLNDAMGRPVNARQRRWLHAAAMAEFITEEMLAVMVGGDEAKHAFKWLLEDRPFDGLSPQLSTVPPRILISPYLREKIIRTLVKDTPSRHRDFLERLDLYLKLTTKIAGFNDRTKLRTLAPLQPFNLQMLEEALHDD